MAERPRNRAVSEDRLDRALTEWAAVVGEAYVRIDRPLLDATSTATFATTTRALAVVHPGNCDEVQRCVKIASRHGIAIFPVSSGKNWGYGSSVPVEDGVILHLGRMNRIVAYDEDLAYVTIEPGVTQQQLHDFLISQGGKLWMDATGASPECSIIGNTLERGFGHTPMGDHFGAACGFEVVLPTGDVIDTGFARFGASRVGSLSRAGLGPSVDGLFAQSNLGIVTRMTVWLMPAPERFEAFFFMTRRESDLAAIIDALRPLRLDGTLRSVMHIGNDYKVLAGSGQYPWNETEGQTPLDLETMSRLRNRMGLGHWNGSGGLYGTPAQVREAKRRVRRALKGKVRRLTFLNDSRLRLLKRFAGIAGRLAGWDVRRSLAVLDPVYNLLKGVPTSAALGSAYWRKLMPPPADPNPDRDGCGLLWCSPVLPNRGDEITLALETARNIVLEHGFEPQISVSLSGERHAIAVITISYDRDVEGEDERALTCYRSVTETLLSHGYPPYRLNVAAMDVVPATPFDEAIDAVKAALDPQGILAPGRYEPARPAGIAARSDVA